MYDYKLITIVSQNILSHIAHFLYEDKLRISSLPVFKRVCSNEDLIPLQTIQSCIVDFTKADETYVNYINNNDNLMRYLCFQALVCESDENSLTKLPEECQKTFCYFVAYLAMNTKTILKTEGAVIATQKILQAYFDQVKLVCFIVLIV